MAKLLIHHKGNPYEILYDDAKQSLVESYTWYINSIKRNGLYDNVNVISRKKGFPCINLNTVLLGKSDKEVVSYINHNSLDRRSENTLITKAVKGMVHTKHYEDNDEVNKIYNLPTIIHPDYVEILVGLRSILVDKDFYDSHKNFSIYIENGYVSIGISYSIRSYLHRKALGVYTIVDHINGNPLDNRRKNLRKATVVENCRNQKLRSDSKVGFKGVSKCKKYKTDTYRARIQINKKSRITLGIYTDPIEAAKAYDIAAIKYFGEFAKTNF